MTNQNLPLAGLQAYRRNWRRQRLDLQPKKDDKRKGANNARGANPSRASSPPVNWEMAETFVDSRTSLDTRMWRPR
jgi:hypothetical protein